MENEKNEVQKTEQVKSEETTSAQMASIWY